LISAANADRDRPTPRGWVDKYIQVWRKMSVFECFGTNRGVLEQRLWLAWVGV
jgi:hypothetical protein